jgi:cellulose synthase (UDP-forming)
MALNRRRVRTGRDVQTQRGSRPHPDLHRAPVVEQPHEAVLSDRREPGLDYEREERPLSPWRRPQAVRLLVLANLASASFYVMWWVTPGHAGVPLLFGLLAFAEFFNLLHLLGFWWATWATGFSPPRPTTTTFTIDVFIPTYGEPLHVLEKTVEAAVRMDVPHKTFVLDDAARDDVRSMVLSHGAHYVRRHTNRGAKAGNINHALALTNGELVALFDADHVPRKDFLSRVLGYFEDDSVAFVQTPQFYGNARENEVARGAFQQQAIFYGPICRGKQGLDSVFCCGTNVLFSRRAIADVGGFDETSVVEDFVTSMKMHRRGWTSVYYPYVLAEGLGPSNLRDFFRQQFRWARGSVGAFASLEPFKRGFSLTQRFQYFLATTFYLTGLVTPIYVMLPILYLLGGWSAFSPHSGSFVFFYAPYLMLALATIKWGLGGQLRLEHLRYTFGTFPVYAVASLFALLHIPARFRVTAKGQHARVRPPALAYVPVIVSIITVVAIVVGLFLRPLDPRTVINISWALLNLVLMFGIVRVCLKEILSDRPARIPTTARTGMPAVSPAHPLAAPDVILDDGRHPKLPEWTLPPMETERKGLAERVQARPAAIVAALSLFGLFLRTALVNVQSLRLDESLTLKQSEFGLVEMWLYQVQSNVHVPLYHTVVHFWIQVFGRSEWALRLPSVIFGAAAVPLMYLLARRLVGSRAAIFAAAMAAASPFWVWHSNEARMYPLLLMLALGSMVLFLRALDRGGLINWIAYAFVTALSFYTHYFALLMPLVHLAYLGIYRIDRRKVLAWLGAAALSAALFVPWLIALYTLRIEESGIDSLTSGIRPPPPDFSIFGIAYTLLIFLIVFAGGYFGPAALELMSGVVVGTWPLAALGGTIGRAFSWLRTRTAKFLGAWLVLTVGLVFIVNIFKPGLFFQKYLIAASPPVLMALALALSKLFRRRLVGVVLVLALLTTVSFTENFDKGNPVREDFRSASRIISAGLKPGDTVVAIPKFNETPLQYYLDFDVKGLSSPEQPYDLLISKTIPEIAEDSAGDSLWVVTLYERTFDLEGGVELYLERTFERTARHKLGRSMEVRRYEIPDDWEPPTSTLD